MGWEGGPNAGASEPGKQPTEGFTHDTASDAVGADGNSFLGSEVNGGIKAKTGSTASRKASDPDMEDQTS